MDPLTSTSPVQKPSLLTLPLHVRKQILRYTALIRSCPISFECESRRVLRLRRRGLAPCQVGICFRHDENYQKPYERSSTEIWLDDEAGAQRRALSRYQREGDRRNINDPLHHCDHEPLPIALMSVCKQLPFEATEILYSENAFSLNCYNRVARHSFFDLSDQAVQSLQRLHVIYLSDRESIQRKDPIFERFQEPWKKVCQFLSERILPDRLRLSLECFVDGTSTQKKILRPLFRLPNLQHIRFNFGDFKSPKINRNSKSAADSLATKPHDGMVFPFERLSLELQELVISHSDLVVNQGAVQNPSRRLKCLRGITIDSKGLPQPATGICCGTCDENHLWCWCKRYGNGKYSSSCSCPRLSAGLFSTNKHIAELAVRAFYGRNQFYIDGTISQIKSSLSRIPPQRLSYINRLCLDGVSLVDRNISKWQSLVDYLQVRAHSELVVKILFNSPLVLKIFGRENSRLTNFRSWFGSLQVHGKRISVLAPSRSLQVDTDLRELPCDHTWVTIAGPAATFSD